MVAVSQDQIAKLQSLNAELRQKIKRSIDAIDESVSLYNRATFTFRLIR